MENNSPSKWHPEKADVAILVFDKIDFKIEKVYQETEMNIL